MVVHPVRPDQIEDAARIVVASYQALAGAHMSDGYASELADVATRAEQAEVLVALDDDAVVGCVTLVPDRSSPWAERLDPGDAGMRMLAVAPAHQGRGIGQVLVSACVGRADDLGRRTLLLHTTPWMAAAQRLYRRNGFVRAPERDWSPTPDVPLLAFRRRLAGGGVGSRLDQQW